MSTLETRGNWNIAKGKLKQTFARLRNDEMQFLEGKVDELVGRIEKRKARARRRFEQAQDDAGEFLGGHQ